MAEPQRGGPDAIDANGARVLVVEARYYEHIADALWAGAQRALEAAGAAHVRISVPGALEIPQAIAIALHDGGAGTYEGAVALGCVIRGETSHYDIVAGESARGLMDLSIAHGFPIGNGILTVDNEAQALARAGGAKLDKGADAANAALQLISIKRRLAGERAR
jgi:6,7-dimethyl-8-ribityllumazine synthase